MRKTVCASECGALWSREPIDGAYRRVKGARERFGAIRRHIGLPRVAGERIPRALVRRGRLSTLARGLLCVTALSLVLGPLAPLPRSANAADVFTFRSSIGPELSGASWMLINTNPVTNSTSILAQGTLSAADTVLSVQIPITQLSQFGAGSQYILHALRPLSANSGWSGGYITGLTPNQIQAGIREVDAHLHLDRVTLNAQNTSPNPAVVQTTGVTGQPEVGTSPSSKVFSPAAPGTNTAPPEQSSFSATYAGSTLPVQSCVAQNRCGTAAQIPSTPSCRGLGSGWDCIVDSKEIYGVFTFRGYAAKVAGADNTFDVQQYNTDSVTEGYRASAGPFSVSGSTSMSSSMGSDEIWPTNGSCWTGYPADPNGCAPDGSLSEFGYDTWRWEKHAETYCGNVFACANVTYEVLYDEVYDGGTQSGYWDTTNYYRDPNQVQAGQAGNWTAFLAGSTDVTYLTRSWSYDNAAAVSVSATDAYSSTTFEASETYQTSQKVVNRNVLQANPWQGTYLRYDNGQAPWQAEFWTCWLAGGYSSTSGNPCWAAGT